MPSDCPKPASGTPPACPETAEGSSSVPPGAVASLTLPVAGGPLNPNVTGDRSESVDTTHCISGPGPSGPKPTAGASRDRRRDKSQKNAAEHQRISLALWPTAAIKKDLRDAAGQDPDPVKLLSSTRFRDLWTSFSKEPKPTSRMLVDLRKLVVEIMMVKGGRGRRTPNHQSSKLTESNASSKRKNRSLSLERSSSPKATLQSKIPRIGATPPSGNKPSTSTPKPSLEGVEEEDADLVVDEASEPTLEEFAADVRDALPNYANVAEGKNSKPDYPYILYVHSGTEERRTMSRETWTVLLEKIQVATLDLALKGEGVRIEWTGYARGVGLIAPADAESRDKVKDLVASLKVADDPFRAWAKGEKGDWTPLSIRIPATMTKKVFTAGKIMTAACLLNKLPDKDSFHIRDCNEVKNSKDRLLRISAKKDLVDALVQLDGIIYVAASKLRVYYQRNPLTKDSKL